jgi:hypothetical protein
MVLQADATNKLYLAFGSVGRDRHVVREMLSTATTGISLGSREPAFVSERRRTKSTEVVTGSIDSVDPWLVASGKIGASDLSSSERF